MPEATSTAHVVSFPWRRAFRAPGEVIATRRLLDRTNGVAFAVVGSSSGGNGIRNVNRTLSLRRFVAVIEWHDAAAAATGRASLEERWRGLGAQVWSAGLAPVRSTGTWRGVSAFAPVHTTRVDGVDADASGESTVASVTYAGIRASKLAHFYMRGFPRSTRRMMGAESPALAGIGFGDVPVRHACTFSVWPSSAELTRIAYGRTETHGIVSRRSNDEGWLFESLFARFEVIDHAGNWAGSDPLA